MTDKETKKKLISSYKGRLQTGGVYIIRNTSNNRLLLDATPDMDAAINRFSFAQATGSCINVKLAADWAAFGSSAFVFEPIETIEKNETQTAEDFRKDVQLLKKLWIEKYDPAKMY